MQTITPSAVHQVPPGAVLVLSARQYRARSHNVKLLARLDATDEFRVKTNAAMHFKRGDTFKQE